MAGTGSLHVRDYRGWGVLVAVLAWLGFVVSHLVGAPQVTAVFAVIDVLTWGQAFAALAPTEDGLEFSVVSVATSASVLILAGLLLVELRLTGAFAWLFVSIGALSLLVQIVSHYRRPISVELRRTLPQKVPSIIDGKIVLEER